MRRIPGPSSEPVSEAQTGVIANYTDAAGAGTSETVTGSTTTILANAQPATAYRLVGAIFGFVLANSANNIRCLTFMEYSTDGGGTWATLGNNVQNTVNSGSFAREPVNALGEVDITAPTGSIQIRARVQRVSGGATGDATWANLNIVTWLYRKYR